VHERLYTFFPFTASGVTLMFDARSLRSDDEAFAYARWLLQEEPSASEVFVCEGEREVSLEKRRIRLKLIRSRPDRPPAERDAPD
jgi:hypothetical protein